MKMVQAIVKALEVLRNGNGSFEASTKGQEKAIKKGRKALQDAGFNPNPVGAGNSKTELPGTYRPVGKSCPSSCALLGAGCYAQKGRVALAQVRAETDLSRDLSSAGLAMTVAVETEAGPARLHVAGDMLREGALDKPYMEGLKEMAKAVRKNGKAIRPNTTMAFGYSHANLSEEDLSSFRDAGIVIRPSLDKAPAPGGAFVAEKDFSNFKEIKLANPGVKVAKCREQLEGISCAKCRLCWERTDLCILFAKH